MPATFGTGTAAPSFDPRCTPVRLAEHNLAGGEVFTVHWLPNANVYIVTAIDVVSNGISGGGRVTFQEANSGRTFWSINTGADVDTFSWRGYLVVPFQSACGLIVNNITPGPVEIYVSGLATANAAVAVI